MAQKAERERHAFVIVRARRVMVAEPMTQETEAYDRDLHYWCTPATGRKQERKGGKGVTS